ncbi:pilus assembly protein [Parahaliea mediterranea]|uniref:pilus assembly protein n=1 Tax=Parahaliea mediterranea TaxID=651086 RepID=UPI000E2ED264|nr:PilC/PilY family type IV pilus protein [Parahaliea mediterranea]
MTATWSRADDIDIYHQATGGDYLLLALEIRPSAYAIACNTLQTCGPQAPLPALRRWMGEEAAGPVTHLDSALAQLAAQFAEPALPTLALAVVVVGQGQPRLLGAYAPLGEHRARLLADLQRLRQPPPSATASPRPVGEDALQTVLQTAWRTALDALPGNTVGRHSDSCPQRNRLRLTLQAPALVGGSEDTAWDEALTALLAQLRPSAYSLAEPGLTAPIGSGAAAVFLPVLGLPAASPWPGNLKQYRLPTRVAGSRRGQPMGGHYLDARGEAALVHEGHRAGRISPRALSAGTDPATLPGWAEGADGDYVRLGGFGQRLRQQVNDGRGRTVYLAPAQSQTGDNNALVALSADVATLDALPYLASELGVENERDTLAWIDWLLGQDVDDLDSDGDTTESRPWLLGALFHSRPLALRYAGSGTNAPQVRVFVGSGGGLLHAFDGSDGAAASPRAEAFAFVPRELLAAQKPQRHSAPPLYSQAFYGVDGSPAPLLLDRNGDGQIQPADGDRALVYFGLRRGGAAYYALEVSDPAAAPVLRWKILPAGDFAELGLSFATPLVGRVQFDGRPRQVVILSGGYDGGRDSASDPIGKDAGRAADTRGNALFIVDAFSGELLWKAVAGAGRGSDTRFEHPALQHGIPSPPAALRDSRGLIYRLYVGDSGGNVWRIDLPPGQGEGYRRQHWSVTRLAALGEAGASGDRRFFHPPDIVRSRDAEGRPFDGVLIASGNRAAPLSTAVQDGLFYLRDYAVAPGAPRVAPPLLRPADLPDRSDCARAPTPGPAGGAGMCSAPPPVDDQLRSGWRWMFPAAGEKGLSSPLTEAGTVYLTSYVPATQAQRCAGEVGHSVLYRLRLKDATALSLEVGEREGGGAGERVGEGMTHGVFGFGDGLLLPGAGLPPSPASAVPAAPPDKLVPQQGPLLYRLYWREPGRDDL